ncbi:MAG: hypothetical protein E6600_04665 [Anaerocolumna aminovalerica]|uniref:DUF7446 family protein n=1 Tax=Anaerocolumna aminovalerica TaxID=1527 RepID=UPI00290A5441|nr:hypothetical protein [Anaerocolumna aminovalerica]MDU6263775.1 hypothetical protein [Anaerocolumna aminovalerica]
MSKKLVVSGLTDTIFLSNIRKNGTMNTQGREDKTDEAIRAVANHMIGKSRGKAGFEYSFPGIGTLSWTNETGGNPDGKA